MQLGDARPPRAILQRRHVALLACKDTGEEVGGEDLFTSRRTVLSSAETSKKKKRIREYEHSLWNGNVESVSSISRESHINVRAADAHHELRDNIGVH